MVEASKLNAHFKSENLIKNGKKQNLFSYQIRVSSGEKIELILKWEKAPIR